MEHHHIGAEYAFAPQGGAALRAHRRLRGLDRQPPEQDPPVGRPHHRHLIGKVRLLHLSYSELEEEALEEKAQR